MGLAKSVLSGTIVWALPIQASFFFPFLSQASDLHWALKAFCAYSYTLSPLSFTGFSTQNISCPSNSALTTVSRRARANTGAHACSFAVESSNSQYYMSLSVGYKLLPLHHSMENVLRITLNRFSFLHFKCLCFILKFFQTPIHIIYSIYSQNFPESFHPNPLSPGSRLYEDSLGQLECGHHFASLLSWVGNDYFGVGGHGLLSLFWWYTFLFS